MARRDFGSVRRLPSGRWQARFEDPDARVRSRVFATRGDASRFLADTRIRLYRGDWFDPESGQRTLTDYAAEWLIRRRVKGQALAPRTAERYAALLRVHIEPVLGDVQLRKLTTSLIRNWHADLAAKPLAPATVAKTYRLLHAICVSALSEGEIAKNPCAIPGASGESNPERPIATLAQVLHLADAVGPRWRATVLLATFCGLRFGELAALTTADFDLPTKTVTVRADLDELDGGQLQVGRVKSAASLRTIAIPDAILSDIETHLEHYAKAKGVVFTGANGGRMRRGNFRQQIWKPAVAAVGVPHLRFHDLRHTGNTLAATTGASTRELMSRMGHASTRAALIYQHATRDRDTAIAAALSELLRSAAGESATPAEE